jgi:hypothetical protein
MKDPVRVDDLRDRDRTGRTVEHGGDCEEPFFQDLDTRRAAGDRPNPRDRQLIDRPVAARPRTGRLDAVGPELIDAHAGGPDELRRAFELPFRFGFSLRFRLRLRLRLGLRLRLWTRFRLRFGLRLGRRHFGFRRFVDLGDFRRLVALRLLSRIAERINRQLQLAQDVRFQDVHTIGRHESAKRELAVEEQQCERLLGVDAQGLTRGGLRGEARQPPTLEGPAAVLLLLRNVGTSLDP